mmetsp:Transcript_54276/g.151006  ORF Transcript_54276/g.151006 Transcript_54276/m.151006 type:complete len:546 (+) Transcript_54276:1646-3283(+)
MNTTALGDFRVQPCLQMGQVHRVEPRLHGLALLVTLRTLLLDVLAPLLHEVGALLLLTACILDVLDDSFMLRQMLCHSALVLFDALLVTPALLHRLEVVTMSLPGETALKLHERRLLKLSMLRMAGRGLIQARLEVLVLLRNLGFVPLLLLHERALEVLDARIVLPPLLRQNALHLLAPRFVAPLLLRESILEVFEVRVAAAQLLRESIASLLHQRLMLTVMLFDLCLVLLPPLRKVHLAVFKSRLVIRHVGLVQLALLHEGDVGVLEARLEASAVIVELGLVPSSLFGEHLLLGPTELRHLLRGAEFRLELAMLTSENLYLCRPDHHQLLLGMLGLPSNHLRLPFVLNLQPCHELLLFVRVGLLPLLLGSALVARRLQLAGLQFGQRGLLLEMRGLPVPAFLVQEGFPRALLQCISLFTHGRHLALLGLYLLLHHMMRGALWLQLAFEGETVLRVLRELGERRLLHLRLRLRHREILLLLREAILMILLLLQNGFLVHVLHPSQLVLDFHGSLRCSALCRLSLCCRTSLRRGTRVRELGANQKH